MAFVAIMMGSDSDLPVLEKTMDILDKLQVRWEAKVASIHRTPADVKAYVEDAEQRGCAVFICAAGLAAHLAGCVAGLTCKPVIGIPVDAGPLRGADALHSTVMMPGGVPVACVAIGSAGATNAAYLAGQILAISDRELSARLLADRAATAEAVRSKDRGLQEKLAARRSSRR
jgi:5-(carboxyamino)imidazole ribonucleotide mutase|eukprot:Tamp_28993.p2 GENE.Tamp_28993~~Tamp_28993.p2  ORF type:complete len:173 (-),score=38.13 Tamp_28993:111-629(-)